MVRIIFWKKYPIPVASSLGPTVFLFINLGAWGFGIDLLTDYPRVSLLILTTALMAPGSNS